MKLKLCPFCGRTKTLETVMFNDACFVVACCCGAEAPRNSTSANGAARIWNRRRWPRAKRKDNTMTNQEKADLIRYIKVGKTIRNYIKALKGLAC